MLSWKKKLLIYLCSLLPILALAGYAFVDQLLHNYVLEIDVIGSSEIHVEYGDVYTDEGATAIGYGIIYDNPQAQLCISVSDNIDYGVLGTYQITYHAQYADVEKDVVRTVYVEDTTAPEITLIKLPDTYTIPGNPYEEEGFYATDAHDGDLTHLVSSEEKDGKVIYQVIDSSGNIATVEREIYYYDPTFPELVLKGDSVIGMQVGKDYVEPGYVATDNCDGDITDKVTVSGKVDGHKEGSYELTYSVEDSFGNVTEVKRTVVVAPHIVQEYVENPEKIIYLTFDDGPGPDTPELLDVLKKYHVKASFFVVNTAYINTITRASEEGHTVAMHTATHNFRKIYASEEAYFKDLDEIQGLIKDLTGIKPKLLRFPGGSSNTVSSFNKGIMTRLTEKVVEEGYRYFDWNVDSCDAGGAVTAEEVYNNVVAGVTGKNTAVVLMHDIKGYTIEAVDNIIEWGLENGYAFRALDHNSPGFEHGIYN